MCIHRPPVTTFAHLLLLLIVALAGVALAQSQPSPRALPDFVALVKREGPAVVNISTVRTVRGEEALAPGLSPGDPLYEFFRRFMPPPDEPREFKTRTLGSGFIIAEDGYIMTNAHVVAQTDEVTVKLTDKREFQAKVIGADLKTDVALIKIPASGLPKVAIGDSTKLEVGEWVAAIGSPFGFENSVTVGVVSAMGRLFPDESYVPFVQTDVAVNPGNSGGPLFNTRGEVVGVNSMIYSRTGGFMGLSFAIPIDLAMEVAWQLRTHGKVTRGRLGVQIQEVTPELARSFGLRTAGGALVTLVERGGPADKAGVLPGDVILKFGDKAIEASSDLPRLVASMKPGSRVKAEVWRRGVAKELVVTIGEIPSEPVVQAREPSEPSIDRLGLGLRELTPDQREQLNVSGGLRVQMARGPALKAGIRRADVILAVNDVEVKTVQQFNDLVAQFRSGQSLALLVLRGDAILYVPLPVP